MTASRYRQGGYHGCICCPARDNDISPGGQGGLNLFCPGQSDNICCLLKQGCINFRGPFKSSDLARFKGGDDLVFILA